LFSSGTVSVLSRAVGPLCRLGARCGLLPATLTIVAVGAGSHPAAPAHAAETAVDAGSLTVTIERDPWRLEFRDRAGDPVLREHGGRSLGPIGSLGFRTAAGWYRATQVIAARREGGAYEAELRTTDPADRRLAITLAPDGNGVIGLNARVTGVGSDAVSALGIGFEALVDERYIGFGERSNAVDQRGNEVETYVGEGPFQFEERPLIAPFVPPWGHRPRDDATYFPIPWLLSTAGYGVLVDNTETIYHRLGSETPDAWSLEVVSAPEGEETLPAPERLRLRVFAGPTPAAVLRRFTARTGRQPRARAPWVFGPWFQPTGEPEAQREQAESLREADAPVSVAQTYTHYLPCGDERGEREEERARTAFFHRAGLAVTTYLNPMLCADYQPAFDQAARAGALTQTEAGTPYIYRYSTASQFLVGQFDFSARAGSRHFERFARRAMEDGHDGWMEDFGEYTPLDSRSANGMDGTEMHNLYPVLYHCASHRFTSRQRRPLVSFVRSGFTGAAPCLQVVWNGDPTTGWGFDGLASAVKNGLTMGLSGISTWGSDVGGFFALGENELTPELLKRWVQLGAVSGVMRTQAEGIAVPPKGRPQIWEEGQLSHWRRYAKLRTQLYPYLRAAETRYRRSGLPIMRHLSLAYPRDRRAGARDDQFLFGPDLLAAPVLEPGTRSREVYLPRGRWVDLWRSVSYRQGSGGLRLRRARMLAGRRSLQIPAPLGQLPLLVRRGAVLALLPPAVDTLAGYGDGQGVVRLRDRRDRLRLIAFPRGRSKARFNQREWLISRASRGRWELRIKGKRARRYRLQAALSTMRRPFKPCRVLLAGRPLPRRAWGYAGGRGVLEARFRTRGATLTVLRRCGGKGSASR
jgi:alpha-glucosidase (family GH31 glycosyl hydrolase)